MKKIPLFYPNISLTGRLGIFKELGRRWIGQGQTVKDFEQIFEKKIASHAVSVNSGTSALELAYYLLGLKSGDEVITPIFTCTATNIPLVRRGVKIVFADVKDNLLLDFDDVKKKITPRTKAVINVHLFGIYNKAPVLSVPIIGDSCQYLGKTEGELFTAYSFQATKIITTIDGGMLVCKRKSDYMRAKLLRWYGIDRETRQPNIDVRIHEAGYKYHMNDMTALLGIDGLNHLDSLLEHRMKLQNRYKELIGGYGGSPYLIHSLHRNKLITQLARYGIEAGLVHKRNDIHPIFGEKRQDVPTMNRIEHQYIFLPCHNHMTIRDVDYICRRIKEII